MFRSPHVTYKQQGMSNWLVNPTGKLSPEMEGDCGIAGAIILQPLNSSGHTAGVVVVVVVRGGTIGLVWDGPGVLC